jgi:hypothetical protein
VKCTKESGYNEGGGSSGGLLYPKLQAMHPHGSQPTQVALVRIGTLYARIHDDCHHELVFSEHTLLTSLPGSLLNFERIRGYYWHQVSKVDGADKWMEFVIYLSLLQAFDDFNCHHILLYTKHVERCISSSRRRPKPRQYGRGRPTVSRLLGLIGSQGRRGFEIST